MKYDDVKTVDELFRFMKDNIKYGYVSNSKNIYVRRTALESEYMYHLFREYYLQRPEELLNSLCGICYDQVELARFWLMNHNYNVLTYLTNVHNHSILLYKDNNDYNWFETTFKGYIGIHKFSDLNQFYDYYYNAQKNNTENNEVYLYPFDKVNFGCDFYDYIVYIRNNNKRIVLSKKTYN